MTHLTKQKGYDEKTGLWTSRYYAKKEATSNEVVTKVCGGYKILTIENYNLRKKQK